MLKMIMKTAVFDYSQTSSEDIVALKKVWSTINAYSCPHHYNFHMHTVCSDGQLTPENLVNQALNIGLKGFAVTDHHTIKGFERAKNSLAQRGKQKLTPSDSFPHLWTGIEITSNLDQTQVHLLGYGFSPENSIMEKYFTGDRPRGQDAKAKVVIENIHEAGGLVVLAHPFRYRRDGRDLIKEAYKAGVDGLEAYYAYRKVNPWQPSVKETEIVKKKALKYNLLTTCGTDSHGSNLLVRL